MSGAFAMKKLGDGSELFDVTVIGDGARIVLFAVGAGGNPERHLALLNALADHGCTVVAPHFDRLVAPVPSEHELATRARRLRLALDSIAAPRTAVAGVGHSIGATMLLALAGARATLRSGAHLAVPRVERLDRVALLAPATDFFRAPGALDDVRVPILAWAGTRDVITPGDQVRLLESALAARVPVELHVADGAGHFSFMNVPPPNTVEPLADRDAFLATIAATVCRFVTASPG